MIFLYAFLLILQHNLDLLLLEILWIRTSYAVKAISCFLTFITLLFFSDSVKDKNKFVLSHFYQRFFEFLPPVFFSLLLLSLSFLTLNSNFFYIYILALIIFFPELKTFYLETWIYQIQNSSFIWHILRFSSGIPFFLFEGFVTADFVLSGLIISKSQVVLPAVFPYETGFRYASTLKSSLVNKGEISRRLFDFVQLSLKTQFLQNFNQEDLQVFQQNKKWLGLNTKFNNTFLETKNYRAQLPLHLIAFSRFMPQLDLSILPANPIFFEENILIYNPADLNDTFKLNAAFSVLKDNPSRVLIVPLGTESWRFYKGLDFIKLSNDDINVIKLYLLLNTEFKPQYNNTFSALQIKVNDGIFFSKENSLLIERIEAKTIYAARKSTSFNSKIGEKGKYLSVLDFKSKILILREGSVLKPVPINLKVNPIKLSEVAAFVNNAYDLYNKDDLEIAKNATIAILKTEINNLIVTKK